ncbi:MAG TPA: hypothetical protein VFJ14_11905 [Nocardioidaceae bacterium]|nr:hypothetical protein [Nocardioidaceae bacterium]
MTRRRIRRRWIAVVLACAATLVSAPAAASDAPAFRLQDGEIAESSALVLSRSDPRLAFTVDDSGDSARVFTVDTRSGETVGVTTLAGVHNVDFEALAFAPGGRLLIGDIGDNDAERASVQVHVIDEPGRGDTTTQPRTLVLTYAGGPRDAEALLVDRGRIFVVSKRLFGGRVYRGPKLNELAATGIGQPAVLRPVATAPGMVTDATVLGDGRVVLRSYGAAFVMTSGWDIAQTVLLPPAELGESIAAPPEGSWFYAGSEGEGAPVYRIDVRASARSLEEQAHGQPEPPAAASEPAGDRDVVGGLELWAGAGVLLVGLVVGLLGRVGRRPWRRRD